MITTDNDIRAAATAYRRMREEYEPQEGVFATDPPKVDRCKRILAGLDTADRAIFTLYSDIGSVRKLAALLGVSRGSAQKEVARIRNIIKERYNEQN